jgi:hypothetical protein
VLPDVVVVDELTDRSSKTYALVYERPAGSRSARPPRVERSATIGDGIRLQGYDVLPEEVEAGGSLYLQLHWLVDTAPKQDWTVFTHLVDPESGQVVAGHDSRPGDNSLPTVRWRAGWRILDEYEMHLPDDLPTGEFDLFTGLYAANGAHLPADGAGVRLGSVTVE